MGADSTGKLPEDIQIVKKDESCGHTGKWHGVGQSSIVMPDKIIIIYTTVCGECGSVSLDVKTIQVSTKANPITVPRSVMTPSPIFKR
jgi:hypothetical protein